MQAMSLQLYYFGARGRGEQVRLLLKEAAQSSDEAKSYEEFRVSKDNFAELKGQGPSVLPFGSVPVIKHGDFVLAQAPAIMGYLGRQYGVAPTDAQDLARADSICIAAEDLRLKYFGVFGDNSDEKMATFVKDLWRGRWLPNLEGLLKLNTKGDFFAGPGLSFGDIAMWDALDACVRYIKGADFEGFAGVQAFYDAILNREGIKGYVEGRTD